MSNKENMALEASNLVLGKAGKGFIFYVKWFVFTFKFQIRPLWPEQIIKIDNELLKMMEIDSSADANEEFTRKSKNYKNICNAIATAALFKWWKILLFKRFVSRLIAKAEPENIQVLLDMVKKQKDPERFFFIMGSAIGFSQLRSLKSIKEGTVGLGE